jgi:heme O synthase-like polyprenyltransferase
MMSVKTIADQFSQMRENAGITRTRASNFLMLLKPRVMALAVFAAFVGLIIPPGDLVPFNAVGAVLYLPLVCAVRAAFA